jgi:glycosyltransferase involved in cell wall biosynthesis
MRAKEKPATTPGLALAGRDVLVLSPTPTWPLDAGNRKRVHRICTELQSQGARVHFLYYPFEWWFSCAPQQHLDMMASQWDSFQLLPTSRALQAAPAGSHHQIDEWWDPAIEPMLAWLLQRGRYDAFIVNYPYLSKALEFAQPGTLRILDTHDRFTGRREMLESMGVAPEYFYTTQQEEAKALARADLVWAIKEEEASFFRGIAATPVVAMPHYDPPTPMPPRPAAADGDLVLGMVGARNNVNFRNAVLFINEVLPLLRRFLAPVKIRFGGSMCSDLETLDSLPAGVELAGRFDRPEDFYSTVDAILVPLSFSTGLKIKAVEAFAMGMPVIAHRHAVEGIPVTHPFHSCDSPRQIAQRCIELAFDRSLLDELRQATRDTYAELFARVDAAWTDTTQRLLRRPVIVLAAAPELIDMRNMYSAHVIENLDYLKNLADIVIFFDRPLPGGFSLWCDRFNWRASELKVVFSPAAAAAMGMSSNRRQTQAFPLFHSVESFAALRARTRPAPVWLADLPAELSAGTLSSDELGTGFLRLDALRHLRTHADEALACVLHRYRGLTALRTGGMFVDPLQAQGDTGPVRDVPFWYRFNHPMLPGNRAGPVWILCVPELLTWAESLHEALRLLYPQAPVPVLIAAHAGPAAAPLATADGKLLHLPSEWQKITRGGDTPRLVVDASGGDIDFGILRETLLRAGIPCVSAARHAAVGAAPQLRCGTPGDPLTVGDLLDEITAVLDGRDTGAEPPARFQSDAGWEWVWRKIATDQLFQGRGVKT